jgi:hypothetical protein
LKNVGEAVEKKRYVRNSRWLVEAAKKSSSTGLIEFVEPVYKYVSATQVMFQHYANAGGLR